MVQGNETIDLLNARASTRAYAPTPLTADEKHDHPHAAMRAPTAGNLMLYSIIEIDDQAIKDRLAVTCDDQPFIARAPWVLVFVADLQKWMDLFASPASKHRGSTSRRHAGARRPHAGLLDALIAAQNAVVAADRWASAPATSATSSSSAKPTPSCWGCRGSRSPSPCCASDGPRAGRASPSATSSTWSTRTPTGVCRRGAA